MSGCSDALWARAGGWAVRQTTAFIHYYAETIPDAYAETIPDGVETAKMRLLTVLEDPDLL